MIISVKHKKEFGNDRFYPMNELARVLLELMNRKSFTDDQLNSLKRVGMMIEWVDDNVFKFDDELQG